MVVIIETKMDLVTVRNILESVERPKSFIPKIQNRRRRNEAILAIILEGDEDVVESVCEQLISNGLIRA